MKEANKQGDIESTWDLQWVEQKTVQRILHSLKVNKGAGLDKIPVSLLKDAEVELAHMKMSSACSFIFIQIKAIFIRMVFYLDSL